MAVAGEAAGLAARQRRAFEDAMAVMKAPRPEARCLASGVLMPLERIGSGSWALDL